METERKRTKPTPLMHLALSSLVFILTSLILFERYLYGEIDPSWVISAVILGCVGGWWMGSIILTIIFFLDTEKWNVKPKTFKMVRYYNRTK